MCCDENKLFWIELNYEKRQQWSKRASEWKSEFGVSRHLVSGHSLFHQVSPSQFWSASISLSSYCHLQYLSRGLICISHLHMSKPSQPSISEELCHRVHVCLFPEDTFLTCSSLVFSLADRNMRISAVCNFLSSFFLTAQHSAPYVIAGFIAVLYTLSFNCVCMFLSYITPVVSIHFDHAIFTLLF